MATALPHPKLYARHGRHYRESHKPEKQISKVGLKAPACFDVYLYD